MRWFIFVCLLLNHAKITPYIPGSVECLFRFQYLFQFQDGDPFSVVGNTICRGPFSIPLNFLSEAGRISYYSYKSRFYVTIFYIILGRTAPTRFI